MGSVQGGRAAAGDQVGGGRATVLDEPESRLLWLGTCTGRVRGSKQVVVNEVALPQGSLGSLMMWPHVCGHLRSNRRF